MTRFYVHVEAVNIVHMVYDTHDLSTIRGGSFALLDAMQKMAESFKDRIHPVTVAASQGLFEAEGDTESLETLRRAILLDLKKRTQGHATFLVAIEDALMTDPESENFPLILERLHAQIRRQQWRMPTVAIPSPAATESACFLDGWRPGAASYGVDPDEPNARISKATEYRRKIGREFKHKLFAQLLGGEEHEENLCAKDLGILATDSGRGVLNGKIALIHVDGNSFGAIRHTYCRTAETRRLFDAQIQQGCRKPFLRALLEKAQSDSAFQTKDDQGNQALRLEVLLWGGDELTLVVPAWCGWQVLDLYYRHANKLKFQGIPLSQRAAMIFCHHNAPILQIRKLAEELLARTRKDIGDGFIHALNTDAELVTLPAQEQQTMYDHLSNHRFGNAAHYLVLKSFDMLGGTLDPFLRNYYANTNYQHLMLYAHELDGVLKQLRTVHAYFPKGKALEIVAALQMNDSERISQLYSRLLATIPPNVTSKVEAALAFLTADKSGRWQLITDLWDFVGEWEQ